MSSRCSTFNTSSITTSTAKAKAKATATANEQQQHQYVLNLVAIKLLRFASKQNKAIKQTIDKRIKHRA